MYEKLTKCPDFTWFLPEKLSKYPNVMIFARKNNKIPEWILHELCPKNARILHNNCPKNIFPDFFLGGGLVPFPPPYPTAMVVTHWCSYRIGWSSISAPDAVATATVRRATKALLGRPDGAVMATRCCDERLLTRTAARQFWRKLSLTNTYNSGLTALLA